jgi:drug/metabolite transporter (DMT)-like permease
MDGRLGLKVWAALVIVYVFWGSTYLAIKYVVDSAPPFIGAGTRFLVAGLIMLVVVLALRGRAALRMTRAELGNGVLVGVLLLCGGNGVLAIGEQRVPSGLAALIIASVPLWIVVLRTALGDRPRLATVLGIVLGLAGVAVLMLPGGSVTGTSRGHALLIVAASVSWAAGSVLATRRPVPRDPLTLTTVEMLAGGVALLVVAAPLGEWSGFAPGEVRASAWIGTAYLIVFGSLVAFTAYVYVLGAAPVSLVSTYAYVNPVIAVLLGVLIRHEQLTAATVVGALVIVAAVAVVVTEEGRSRARAAARRREREAVREAA